MILEKKYPYKKKTKCNRKQKNTRVKQFFFFKYAFV